MIASVDDSPFGEVPIDGLKAGLTLAKLCAAAAILDHAEGKEPWTMLAPSHKIKLTDDPRECSQ